MIEVNLREGLIFMYKEESYILGERVRKKLIENDSTYSYIVYKFTSGKEVKRIENIAEKDLTHYIGKGIWKITN